MVVEDLIELLQKQDPKAEAAWVERGQLFRITRVKEVTTPKGTFCLVGTTPGAKR